MQITQEQIDSFWRSRGRFLHTTLSTETPLQQTARLSDLCKNNLQQAVALFHQVELTAIDITRNHFDTIIKLSQDIKKCIAYGGNIYITGCGASARLAILLQKLWNLSYPNLTSRLKSICAGGDVSIMSSVEQFEDSESYGVTQLTEFKFTAKDLLIGLTASGQSPFILAGITFAKNNHIKPWLICNNNITDIVSRNNHYILKDINVNTMAIDVGGMALTGSTRLQATSVMQLAVGLALLNYNNISQIQEHFNYTYDYLSQIDISQLDNLIEAETTRVNNKECILYSTNNDILCLSLLADITERAPTFNIIPLENYSDGNCQDRKISQFYLQLTLANTVTDAWLMLLNRSPFCLNVPYLPQTTLNYFYGFDVSSGGFRGSKDFKHKQMHETWFIDKVSNILDITLANLKLQFSLPQDNLTKSLLYKLLLNTHSTLMFGRLGAFDGNLMLSLTPTNNKLIDRSIRYVLFVLQHTYNQVVSYEDVANVLFAEVNQLNPNESIVQKVVQKIRSSSTD